MKSNITKLVKRFAQSVTKQILSSARASDMVRKLKAAGCKMEIKLTDEDGTSVTIWESEGGFVDTSKPPIPLPAPVVVASDNSPSQKMKWTASDAKFLRAMKISVNEE